MNSPADDFHPAVTRDGVLYFSSNRIGGHGMYDLWITRREAGGWSTLQNLGSPVNSQVFEYGPFVSPDQQNLYFTSHRRGLGDVVRIPVDDVPLLAAMLGKVP